MSLLASILSGRWCVQSQPGHCCNSAAVHVHAKSVASDEGDPQMRLVEEVFDPQLLLRGSGASTASPLPLSRLQDAFDLFGGGDVRVTAKQLGEIWQYVSRQHGQLDEDEFYIIDYAADACTREMDLIGLRDARVSLTDVTAFMLDMRVRSCAPDLRPHILEQLRSAPSKWDDIVMEFVEMNTSQTGLVTHNEFNEFIGPCFMNSAMFDKIDCNGDGLLDIWEYAAYRFGLERVPVELLLYDLSEGLAEQYSNILLGQNIEAVYHTSVLVHGKEYFYGKCIYQNSTPPLQGQFGTALKKFVEPLKSSAYVPGLDVYPLGYTFASESVVKTVASNLSAGSYGNGRYHPLTNNCNHFAHEFAMNLTGSGIPAAVRKQTEMFLRSSAIQAVLPALKSWHGMFGDSELAHCLTVNGKVRSPDSPFAVLTVPPQDPSPWVEVEQPMDLIGQICAFRHGAETTAAPGNLGGQQQRSHRSGIRYGMVVSASKSTASIRWFDPSLCSFSYAEDVALSSVMSWFPASNAFDWHYNHNMNKYYVVDV
mmetsp:Transcript_21644/g.50592  ORF Transcript_21644/g.50592 Transcript_21644/m.50592 type:complete len:537 (-) Transcript_21644:4-1614(-)